MEAQAQLKQALFWHSLPPLPCTGSLVFFVNEQLQVACQPEFFQHAFALADEEEKDSVASFRALLWPSLSRSLQPSPKEEQLFACLSSKKHIHLEPSATTLLEDLQQQDPSLLTCSLCLVSEQFAGPLWCSFYQLLPYCNELEVALVGRAIQLAQFQLEYRFCGYCGSTTSDTSFTLEYSKVCSSCSQLFYPRQDPSVIGLIEHQNRLLLAHNKNFSTGTYSLIAGYVDAGETLEQAFMREAMEEANAALSWPNYISSQPWPRLHSLMCGFFAKSLTPPELCRPDQKEIESLIWLSRNELREHFSLSKLGQARADFRLPRHGSIARKLLWHWLQELEPEVL